MAFYRRPWAAWSLGLSWGCGVLSVPGWLAGCAATCWTGERGHGVRVQIELGIRDVSGILGIIFCIGAFGLLCSSVQKILKINENAEKTLWWDGGEQPCHLYPWISNQDLWCKADFPKRILCVLLWSSVWCVAGCLSGEPGLLRNWFWGKAAESWRPEAL